LSSGTLSPVFSSATTSYTAIVPSAVSSINVTPATANVHATIKVNGTSISSGTATSIMLNVGINTITTVVTAQDGTTTQTYTITIGRGASNTNLSNLKINNGAIPLTPTFNYTDRKSTR